MKKIIVIILTMAMIISTIPCYAHANEHAITKDFLIDCEEEVIYDSEGIAYLQLSKTIKLASANTQTSD